MAIFTSEQLLYAAFGLFLIGAAVALLFGREWRRIGYTSTAFMLLASLMLWMLASRVFTSGAVDAGPIFALKPIGASLEFRIDALSAVFLLVTPFIGLVAMLYSVEYMNKLHHAYSPRLYYGFILLLLFSVVGVVTSSDLFFFFVFWELMTLTSWMLVWFDREDETKVRAAWQYFIVTHVATAGILVSALVIYSHSNSFAFTDVSKVLGTLSESNRALTHLLMGLFLVGFMTKAGVLPFGAWLPNAYPAAPSPASSTFAGTMTKLGIYGVVRVAFGFFPAELSIVWGVVIAVLGAGSIFVGTLTALRQDDTKRLLAFHIIGQTGYMLLGIGTGLFFLTKDPVLGAIALVAGLYHVVNNAVYKPLLFMSAGAAEFAAGSRDLNKLGGLGAAMPITLTTAVIAALSIAGIPPFNGFASKWLIYQSTIEGGIGVPLFLLLGVVAAFVSLVTLASFMKFIGSVFLGKPSPLAKGVRSEVPLAMTVPQVALAAVCVVAGVVPFLPLTVLYKAASSVLGTAMTATQTEIFGSNPAAITLSMNGEVFGVWNPAYILAALILCSVGAYALSRVADARRREVPSWYGGEEVADNEVRYRAHGFVLPFKEAFAAVYPTIRLPKMPALKKAGKILDFDRWLYKPVVDMGGRMVDRLSRTHIGIPQVYMLWQLIGVIVVLAVLLAVLRA